MTEFLNNDISPSLSSIIEKIVRNALLDTNVAIPGIIQKFTPDLQEVEVELVVKREIVEPTDDVKTEIIREALPVLIQVPVVQMQGGRFFLTTPIKPGDEALVIFSQRDMDRWYTSARTSDPNSYRQHDLSDAIAIVGLNSKPKKIVNYNNSDIELRDETGDTRIRITPDDDIYIEAANDLNILVENDATIEVGNNATIDVIANADITVGAIATLDVTTSMLVTCPTTTWTGNIIQTGSFTQVGAHTVTGVSLFTGAMGIVGPITASGTGGLGSVFEGPIVVQGLVNATGNLFSQASVIGTVDVTTATTTLNSHVHGGVTTGAGFTGTGVG